MKRFVRLVSAVLAVAVVAWSCSKDESTGSLEFDTSAVFVEAGETVTVGFKTSTNIAESSLTVISRPKGWDAPGLNTATHTLTFTVPEESKFDDEVVRSGSFVLSGAPNGGKVTSVSLFVAVVDDVDLGAPANSYIISNKDTHYTFDARYRGGDLTQVLPDKIALIWQSQASLIQYVSLEQDRGSFYVGSDDGEKFREGNAVIGAYDNQGGLIWSWHIWVTGTKIDVIPGTRIMNCNLGALSVSNSSESDIQKAYGLYYQWGRKDPFVGPATYNAAGNTNAPMYTAANARVYIKVETSDEKTGTMEYAVQNPLSFLAATKNSDYDWLYSAHSNTLWAETKTVNDPCPAGWRVAGAASFDALTLKADQWGDTLPREKYSATLLSGTTENLFFGIGRRSYDGGVIQNYYFPNAAPKSLNRAEEQIGQPWVALYWTSGTQADNTSSALYFHYGATSLDKAHSMRRANAMPVRCVKE